MTRQVRLGEDISRLVNRANGEQLEIAFLDMLASDVAIDFNVLGAVMEDIIMSNVDSTMIVTIKRSGNGLWSIHVNQKPAKPDKLVGGVGKSTILSISTGTGNHILLLAMPQEKKSSQQETETCDRVSISRITYPVCI